MKESFVGSVFLVLLGIVLKHCWDKIQNRLIYLNYSVWHKSLGASITDNLFGNVQILYNNNPVSNLYFSTLLIENNGSRDLENIELNIYSDTSSVILVSHGYLDLSPNPLMFTEEYSDLLARVDTDAAALTAASTRRDYKVPVLNRGDKLNIQMLITNHLKEPNIFCSSDHAGIKMKLVAYVKDFYGESAKHCAWIGSIISLAVCWPLIQQMPSDFLFLSVIAGTIIGLMAMVWGWLAIKILKIVVRVVG